MFNSYEELPSEIRAGIRPNSLVDIGTARLGNKMFRIKTTDSQSAILKVGSYQSAADIDNESERLKWINGRAHAPKFIAYAQDDRFSYSLQSWLGEDVAHQCIGELPNEVIVKGFAEALKKIHAIDISTCPFTSVLDSELQESERRLNAELIAEDDFYKEVGEYPSKVFEYLVKTQHIIEENIFTHGDYCLPNVIFDHDQVRGVVDWGLAGVADFHRDFMSVELTLRRNMDEDNIRYFYQVYGVNVVDRERVHYYWLLDRFFSHYQPGE